MISFKHILGLVVGLLTSTFLMAQSFPPDDVEAAFEYLKKERTFILQQNRLPAAQRAGFMMRLGLIDEAGALLDQETESSKALNLAKAKYLMYKNDFSAAETLVSELLKKNKDDREARIMKAKLEIEAWRLKEAENMCLDLLKNDPKDEEIVLLLGKVYILQKNYQRALSMAQQVQIWNPKNAGGFYLEADVHFWEQEPQKAEKYLQESLRLDPLNPDARFNYGYAIWRRVDATQLPDMAAQWEFALALDPLHYLTHWHWGNGHTHLTYADYVDADEQEILAELETAEDYLSKNQIEDAITLIRKVQEQYPQSVIPDLMLGSVYYMSYDMEREIRLDSAENIFQDILKRKPHFGPAHNGLAAVIKARRMTYLDAYEKLEKDIAETEVSDLESFTEVFPDAAYYPGDRVQKMIWNQLESSVAYFPFLARLNRVFVIPPLHIDLARAMKNSYFRGGTTFDNRQWMDIRGVGSGATGIEYVERGAHQERNVTLHEYVHLFHGTLFSDQEMRQVRERYYYAMENDLTLDYYSANNEFEYFAQTYPAYFIQTKVHPLNHKSINTRSDLIAKDPLMFAFIDSLVKRQEAYLAGDSSALADNWAEVYISLARQSQRANNVLQTRAYLDSALTWDSLYLPVYLAYADILAGASQIEEAQEWLQKAETINPDFAPIYRAFASLVNTQFLNEEISEAEAIEAQTQRYKQAFKLETDLGIRAEMNVETRNFYRNYSLIAEAIDIAEDYGREGPSISTYLRDSRDQAQAFANELKGLMGYLEESEVFFDRLLSLKPQHYRHREQFARVLIANRQYEKAYQVLDEAQKILQAAGNPNANFTALMIMAQKEQGKEVEAQDLLRSATENGISRRRNSTIWTEMYIKMGELEKAANEFKRLPNPKLPYGQGNYAYLEGLLAEVKGETESAIKSYTKAIQANVYHMEARLRLLALQQAAQNKKKVKKIATQGSLLPVPPGKVFMEKLQEYMD